MHLFTKKTVGLYVAFWIIISIAAVSYVVLTEVSLRTYTCVDGSVVKDEATCPQCSEEIACERDNICDDGKCVAKECMVDSDCDDPLKSCIYDKCLLG